MHANHSLDCTHEHVTFEVSATSYGRTKNLGKEIKKRSRTSPELQFRGFSLANKKLDVQMTTKLF